MEEKKLLLRVHEAAKLCSISRSQAYTLVHDEWRSIVFRVGKSIRVSRVSLEKWIASELSRAANNTYLDDAS